MVLEVRTNFAHRLCVHREHRVWQARCHGFVEDVAEISRDALNGGHLYRRGKFCMEYLKSEATSWCWRQVTALSVCGARKIQRTAPVIGL